MAHSLWGGRWGVPLPAWLDNSHAKVTCGTANGATQKQGKPSPKAPAALLHLRCSGSAENAKSPSRCEPHKSATCCV
eukprot:6130342-Alexandrium_andersonii.AAC.1